MGYPQRVRAPGASFLKELTVTGPWRWVHLQAAASTRRSGWAQQSEGGEGGETAEFIIYMCEEREARSWGTRLSR